MKKIIGAVSAICLLAACQQGTNGQAISNSDLGTAIGAAAGAYAGSQMGGGTGNTVATATGTLLGAALGRTIGQSFDNGDLAYYHKASQEAMMRGQPGQVFPWNSPFSNASGKVTPGAPFKDTSGRHCREFTQTINVSGRLEEGHGVACLEPDGTWKTKS